MRKRILFLSALDFKQKSIQVIRKTPEAYAEAGWNVRYIVARDTFERGNYAYEPEIAPAGVSVERFAWPLLRLRNATQRRWPQYLWTRLAGLLVILGLAYRGARALRFEPADIIYGYEVHGVLAVKLLRLFRSTGAAKIVHRFQGTCYVTEMLEKRQLVRQAANLDHLMALRSSCDLVIMTNDGTKGDITLQRLKSRSSSKLRFWVNGTDRPEGLRSAMSIRREWDIDDDAVVLLTVSRLVAWKRVDRTLSIAAALKRSIPKFVLLIVGGGDDREHLESHASALGISDKVRFTGPIPQADVFGYMNAADIFLSTFDMSNVGNPLLEAIRMQKVIVTLNNGDTGRWITHAVNGFIYAVSDDLPHIAARDIERILSDCTLREQLTKGVRELAQDRLWTWRERMRAEITEVEALLET